MSFETSQYENPETQKLRKERLFANPSTLVEGWYPIVASRKIKVGSVKSFVIHSQRIVVWRGVDKGLRATDAFCPHLGADLGNGTVVENRVRCYFHHWEFEGNGCLAKRPCDREFNDKIKIENYQVAEYLGHVWVYAGRSVRSPLIHPPGADTQFNARHIGTVKLLAHHHVMVAGGIDLQHFRTVHKIDIDFKADHTDQGENVFDWRISGSISSTRWRGFVARLFVGERFTYRLRLGAGSMVAISYGEGQKFLGRFLKWPQLHVVWGCVPLKSGVSQVEVFSVVPNRKGFVGKVAGLLQHLLTMALLYFLKDDDVKAFPNMRFQRTNPTPEDKTILQLVRAINQMPESIWTAPQDKTNHPSKDFHLNTGLLTTN